MTPRQPRASASGATGVGADARRALTEAKQARDVLRAQSVDADKAVDAAENQVAQLRRELDHANDVVTEARQRQRTAATALRRAERTVSSAERRNAKG